MPPISHTSSLHGPVIEHGETQLLTNSKHGTGTLGKRTFPQLWKKFPAFYGGRSFITVFTAT